MIWVDSVSMLADMDLRPMIENDRATRRPTQFLADLAQAMRVAAETARQATVEQCKSDANSYTEQLRAGTNGETASLRTASSADNGAIREWSKAEAERIGVEMEERISRRHNQLEKELQEYNSAIDIELQRVGERVQAFEDEVAQFFERLLQGTDPASLAKMASQLPVSPAFGDPDPAALVHDLRMSRSPAVQADSLPVPDQTPEVVTDRWWMDSPAALAARVRAKPGPGEPG
jgi:hypothetical protein